MIIDIIAFLSMFAQDIAGTLMMIAEARSRAVFAALGDTFGYLFGWICQLETIKLNIQQGWSTPMLTLLAVVTVANFWGTFSGVKIGRHIKDPAMAKIEARLEALERGR